MNRGIMKTKRILLIVTLILLAGLTVAHAAKYTGRNNDTGEKKYQSDTGEKTYQSAEADPRAVVKEGFYGGVSKERITLKNMKTHKKASYRLEPDYRNFFNEQEFELRRIPPSSIIKLILIEGQVREIILLEMSS